ncbi:MAG: D-glycero-beta-D-manno-heptose 1-phosphate adenylyltransferase [Lachnospiraceae bacterium]|nr:D-glycero-beta-D-manno-heptose 1-phosphate adenylyltransferase [Butyrivibrio sp.]MCM1343397.1 D-glycero-beta-D-manno-heptose 1-phosphate adenylyltransferase [Muribaculaceae bacterium]MCM1410566.1 D-glycero-beta-D-manno-heptose 1-phosphate adenylyltransferase [Lachnospiraceae bacterium]
MLDIYSFGKAIRISPEAPVPVLLKKQEDLKYTLGGAANVAVNLTATGVDVDILSVTGSDMNSDILLKKLEEAGIHTDYICKDPGRVTTTKLRYIAQNNQQMLRVDTEDVSDVQWETVADVMRVLEERIRQYDLFILSDYQKGFLTPEITQHLIALAGSCHIPVMVDVKDRQYGKYKGAFLLKPNRSELKRLTDMPVESMEEIIEASQYLCRKAESKYVLTTLSMDGLVLVNEQGVVLQVKSVAREVFDVTGAGDTFIAYLGAGIADGDDILNAVKTANYAAGIQVSKIGTGIVYPDEVLKAMGKGKRAKQCRNKLIDIQAQDGLIRLKEVRETGKKIVFTNGCFDVLHVGHVTYLKKAAELGDILVIGVNSDDSVRRLKGESRPVNKLEDRLTILASLEYVDYIMPFEEDTPIELIKAVEPDVLVKGGDYQIADIVGAEFVQNRGGSVTTIPFVEGKSTTAMIHKIAGGRL